MIYSKEIENIDKSVLNFSGDYLKEPKLRAMYSELFGYEADDSLT